MMKSIAVLVFIVSAVYGQSTPSAVDFPHFQAMVEERVANYTAVTEAYVKEAQHWILFPTSQPKMIALYNEINAFYTEVKKYEAYVTAERSDLVESLVERFFFEKALGELHTLHREINHLLDALRYYVQTPAPVLTTTPLPTTVKTA